MRKTLSLLCVSESTCLTNLNAYQILGLILVKILINFPHFNCHLMYLTGTCTYRGIMIHVFSRNFHQKWKKGNILFSFNNASDTFLHAAILKNKRELTPLHPSLILLQVWEKYVVVLSFCGPLNAPCRWRKESCACLWKHYLSRIRFIIIAHLQRLLETHYNQISLKTIFNWKIPNDYLM